nr:hypothetical protein [uncultured Bacteroides sp.]
MRYLFLVTTVFLIWSCDEKKEIIIEKAPITYFMFIKQDGLIYQSIDFGVRLDYKNGNVREVNRISFRKKKWDDTISICIPRDTNQMYSYNYSIKLNTVDMACVIVSPIMKDFGRDTLLFYYPQDTVGCSVYKVMR